MTDIPQPPHDNLPPRWRDKSFMELPRPLQRRVAQAVGLSEKTLRAMSVQESRVAALNHDVPQRHVRATDQRRFSNPEFPHGDSSTTGNT